MYFDQILIVLVTLINVGAFFMMLSDKRRSMRGNQTERISEGALFFIAAAFGSGGVYAGMFIFRHKTRKWYFQLGIPLLILQNLAFLYFIYELVHRG